MQIWKFSIPFSPPNGLAQMPQGAKVLSAGVQDSDIIIWALVDPIHKVVKHRFAIYGTGHVLREEDLQIPFVGTVFMGPFVWHVFDGGEIK